MKQIDKLLNNSTVSHLVVIGALIGFLTAIAAIILYILGDPTFSFLTHWVSHLGTGPNGSDVVFNGGMIYSGIMSWIYSLYLAGFLHKKGAFKVLVVISLGCGITLGVGLLMVGIFPLELIFGIHNVAAGLFFFGGLFSSIFYGLSAYFAKNISKFHSFIAFLTATVFLFYIIINTLHVNISIKIVAEWAVFFAIPVWILSQGILVLRSEKL